MGGEGSGRDLDVRIILHPDTFPHPPTHHLLTGSMLQRSLQHCNTCMV